MLVSDDAYLDAMRTGVRLANSRGVTSVHDKDGWLGAAGLWRRLEQQGSLSLRVWQSVPHDRLSDLRALALRSGFGSPLLRLTTHECRVSRSHPCIKVLGDFPSSEATAPYVAR